MTMMRGKTLSLCSSLLVLLTLFKFPGETVESNELLTSDDKDWPSCAELRSFWLKVRSMTHHSEITNKIPLMPTYLMDILFNGAAQSRRLKSENNAIQSSSNRLSSNHPLGHLVRMSENNAEYSRFSNFGEPQRFIESIPSLKMNSNEEIGYLSEFGPSEREDGSLFLDGSVGPNFKNVAQVQFPAEPERGFLETIRNPENFKTGQVFPKHMSDPWSSATEIGTFRNFADDAPSANTKQKPEQRQNSMWLTGPVRPAITVLTDEMGNLLKSCADVKDRSCSRPKDCICSGEMMACTHGSCQRSSTFSGPIGLEDSGAWHSGPLPRSELGAVTRRRGFWKLAHRD